MADQRIPARTGRPPLTSAARLEEVALQLFVDRGFDETTIDEIAQAAGIARRTFFRYYASKNDLVWGDFDEHLTAFGDEFDRHAELPMMDALRLSVVAFNWVDPSYEEQHRRRMRLILTVSTLQAHSTLRYAAWRAVVEAFVVKRTGELPGTLVPRLVGHLALGTSVAAYEQWLTTAGTDLSSLIDSAFRELAQGFAHREPAR